MSEMQPDEPRRRFADSLIKAFYQGCEAGNLVAANYVLLALESVFKHEAERHPEDRRAQIDTLGELRMHLMLAPGNSEA